MKWIPREHPALGALTQPVYDRYYANRHTDLRFPAYVGVTGLAVIIGLLVCIVVPVALVLSVLRTFAERAAMLENLGVVDAYRRGWQVLVANLGGQVGHQGRNAEAAASFRGHGSAHEGESDP